jgi:hypothetical protein
VIPPEVLEVLERLNERLDEWLREITRDAVREELAALRPAELELMTYGQAAERLGKTYDGVRMFVRRDRLERRKVGRSAYVTTASVRELEGRLCPDTSIAPARQPPPEARPQEAELQ